MKNTIVFFIVIALMLALPSCGARKTRKQIESLKLELQQVHEFQQQQISAEAVNIRSVRSGSTLSIETDDKTRPGTYVAPDGSTYTLNNTKIIQETKKDSTVTDVTKKDTVTTAGKTTTDLKVDAKSKVKDTERSGVGFWNWIIIGTVFSVILFVIIFIYRKYKKVKNAIT